MMLAFSIFKVVMIKASNSVMTRNPARFALGMATLLSLLPRAWVLNVLRTVQIVLTVLKEKKAGGRPPYAGHE
ncbi:hypothetical protein [Pseudomonas silesiensis]|uniref:hypothetical protein n=1 Tax=Pseudomonas silesiensis TaxID=1853130 RepID=UPI0030DABD83